jgi:hypothetical protein
MDNIPQGQMTKEEREYIYNTIIKNNIKSAIESGTWYGGGSTLSLTKGLYETNGFLHTFEEHYDFYEVAKNFYVNSIYSKNIELHNTSFMNGLKNFSDEFFKNVDLILLDGGDELPNGYHKQDITVYLNDYNLSENVESFKFLEEKISVGCHLLLHDWSINIGRGNFVKRYLEDTKNDKFEVVNVIDDGITLTGFAHLIKVK